MEKNIWRWWLFFGNLVETMLYILIHSCCFFVTLSLMLTWLMIFSWYKLAIALLSKLKIFEFFFFFFNPLKKFLLLGVFRKNRKVAWIRFLFWQERKLTAAIARSVIHTVTIYLLFWYIPLLEFQEIWSHELRKLLMISMN